MYRGELLGFYRRARKQAKAVAGDGVKLPESVDWVVFRIASSGKFFASPRQIREEWWFVDLIAAHDVLDAMEQAERDAYERTKA